jgi:hypothetical protein
MTPEAQQKAMAEFCGWLIHGCAHENSGHRYSAPLGTSPFLGRHALPDYLNDLNAMHEAEKLLAKSDLWWRFCSVLNGIICVDADEPMNQEPETLWGMIHATAAQRAEALLRTIGKWQT